MVFLANTTPWEPYTFLRFLGFPPERGGLPSMNACEHLRWQRQMSVHIITTDKIL